MSLLAGGPKTEVELDFIAEASIKMEIALISFKHNNSS